MILIFTKLGGGCLLRREIKWISFLPSIGDSQALLEKSSLILEMGCLLDWFPKKHELSQELRYDTIRAHLALESVYGLRSHNASNFFIVIPYLKHYNHTVVVGQLREAVVSMRRWGCLDRYWLSSTPSTSSPTGWPFGVSSPSLKFIVK